MPKGTNRTKRIKETLACLMKEQSEWDFARLRKSCLDAMGSGDAKERARLGNSIRRTLTQLFDAGVLVLGDGEKVSAGDGLEALAKEIGDDTSEAKTKASEKEKISSIPKKKDAPKKPKEKDMRQLLDELLSVGPLAEAEIVRTAIGKFEVKGEQVHGVRGLTLQVLKALEGEGEIVRTNGAYSKKLSDTPPAAAVPEKREPPLRATAVKIQRASKIKPRAIVSATADSVLDVRSFAALINEQGGDFFNVLVAKLLETYYASVSLRVVGKFVVDGSEDRGIDVVFHLCDELGVSDKVAVQAKTRAKGQITLKEMREFYGCVSAEGATKGIFMTTSTFTTEAVDFIHKSANLAGIDAVKLFELACRYEIGVCHRDGKPYPARELVRR